MIAVVNAISAHLVEALAEAGYPPLTPFLDGTLGKILIGNRHQFEQYMPPRVIFMPTKSVFGPRDTSRGASVVAVNLPRMGTEAKAVAATRAIASETMSFEVACWGIAPEGVFADDGPNADFEFTHSLYHQVIASMHLLMPGCYTLSGGAWRNATHISRVGREFVFSVTIGIPVLDTMAPLPEGATPGDPLPDGVVAGHPYAPSDVGMNHTDIMVSPTGATGGGCADD